MTKKAYESTVVNVCIDTRRIHTGTCHAMLDTGIDTRRIHTGISHAMLDTGINGDRSTGETSQPRFTLK